MSGVTTSTRIIRKSHSHSSGEAADLLAAVLAVEVAMPSTTLWLVSPWISDIPVLTTRPTHIPTYRGGAADSLGLRKCLSRSLMPERRW